MTVETDPHSPTRQVSACLFGPMPRTGNARNGLTAAAIDSVRAFLGASSRETLTRMPMKKVIPVGPYISVRIPKKGEGGPIIIPDTVDDGSSPNRGEVEEVGASVVATVHGERIQPGQTVLFRGFAAVRFEIEDDEIFLVKDEDVLAVIR